MRNSSKESLYSAQRSEPGLDARSESMKIADALNFVIRKFHAKVIFKTGEQFERLQAVDAELLIEIIARAKLGARKFEMSGGEVQDFVRGLFDCVHAACILQEKSARCLLTPFCRQVRVHPIVLDEPAQPFHDGGPREEIAENVDFAAHFFRG